MHFSLGLQLRKSHSIFKLINLTNTSQIKNSILSTCQISTKTTQIFSEFINTRRLEAQNTVIVQVNSEKSFDELHSYCSKFGKIKEAHHYTTPHQESHYILLEFEENSVANEIIRTASHNEDISGIPAQSQFLWFKVNKKQKSQITKINKTAESCLSTFDGNKLLTEYKLIELLRDARNITDQIEILYKSRRLNDLGIRLRFIAAYQIEKSISGIFPNANANLFGSSVNGFGKMGCDLDIVLRFNQGNNKISNSRLVYHTKENSNNGRSQMQRQLESIGDMLQLFLPGVFHVRRILQARVPIIKYHQEHLDLEVDLSISNLTGVYMSELFYMFGEIDARTRPLTFCIRKWAEEIGLTNPSPGRWMTNFSLTCLVLFFLQQLNKPILPPISLLCKSAKSDDVRITEDGINCTFQRNHKTLLFESNNNSSLSDLLLEFFEYYSQFDFSNKAISLNQGKTVPKPDHAALYIVNPLEEVLNVSKNISLEECERFCIEVRNAAWILESETDQSIIKDSKTMKDWGLLSIFKKSNTAVLSPNMFFKSRIVEVRELFGETENMLIEMKKRPYKNVLVKNEVNNVRAKAQSDVKNLG